MKLLCLLAAFCLVTCFLAPTRADAPPGTARALIEQVTHDAVIVLRNSKLDAKQKTHQLRDIAYQNMDFEALSRLTLARAWRDLNAQQQTDFVAEFRKHISATYSHLADDYTDEDVVVTGDRAEDRGDWTVMTKIVGHKNGGGSQDQTKVDYRLRLKDKQWKIIDVTIEDVSMVANFRSQFQEIMNNGGIEKLMKLLRDKNAAADQ